MIGFLLFRTRHFSLTITRLLSSAYWFRILCFIPSSPRRTRVDCLWMQKVMVPRSNSVCYYYFLFKKYPRGPVKSAIICWDCVQKPSQLVCFRLLFSLNFNLYVVKGCAIFSRPLSLSFFHLNFVRKFYTIQKMAWLTTSADLHQYTLERTGMGFVCFSRKYGWWCDFCSIRRK